MKVKASFVKDGKWWVGWSDDVPGHSAYDSPVEVFVEEILDPAHEGVGDWRLDVSCWRSLLRNSL
jgi:hypothetical protein